MGAPPMMGSWIIASIKKGVVFHKSGQRNAFGVPGSRKASYIKIQISLYKNTCCHLVPIMTPAELTSRAASPMIRFQLPQPLSQAPGLD